MSASPPVSPVPVTADLQRLSAVRLLALFKTLEAPSLQALHGEYEAQLLRQPNRIDDAVGALILRKLPFQGQWQCKAFRPLDERSGRGYNTFLQGGRIVQRFPMTTLIAPSRYDGRPAFTLVYRAYHSLCGDIHMVDEIRRLDQDRYLGIGTWGFTRRMKMKSLPFLLSGPVAEYRGDIGRERKGFDVRSELFTDPLALPPASS